VDARRKFIFIKNLVLSQSRALVGGRVYMDSSVLEFVIKGFRRLDAENKKRRRTRDDEEILEVRKKLKDATARVGDLESATAFSTGDLALFYEVCDENGGAHGLEDVVLGHLGGQNGKSPGVHLNRLLAAVLRIDRERTRKDLTDLNALHMEAAAALTVARGEFTWRDAACKDAEQRLFALTKKFETLKRRYTELKERPLDASAAEERDVLQERYDGAMRDLVTATRKISDMEEKIKSQGTTLAGAHQRRIHNAREAANLALGEGHSALGSYLNTRFNDMGMDAETINGIRLDIIPFLEQMRLALGSHLI